MVYTHVVTMRIVYAYIIDQFYNVHIIYKIQLVYNIQLPYKQKMLVVKNTGKFGKRLIICKSFIQSILNIHISTGAHVVSYTQLLGKFEWVYIHLRSSSTLLRSTVAIQHIEKHVSAN